MARLLVVEDDDMLAEGLGFALGRESFEVDRAKTVREAETLFHSRRYDLILLDVMLPDGSGFGLCRTIRSASKVPIIFLTARDEEVHVVLGLDLGGDDYITKPFGLKELISRIRANLRRSEADSAASAPSVLTSGPIEVQPLEGKASKFGKPIELTPVECKLLAMLVRHAGQTLTRAQLMDRLWDEQGEFVDDNTLSVHIRRLREKLEDDPSEPRYITTVRGVGYRFRAGGDPHA